MKASAYYQLSDAQMKNLQILISGIPDPLFIIDRESRKIVQANQTAFSGVKREQVLGSVFEDIVYMDEQMTNPSYAFYNSQWFELNEQNFEWEQNHYAKIVLAKREDIPDNEALETLRNMISVLLHRFRSPLTGMQGYMELLEENIEKDSDRKRLAKVAQGIDQLFDMMDELEVLHNIPDQNVKPQTQSVDPEAVLKDILLSYPAEIRNRIHIKKPKLPVTFECDSKTLRKILSILIKNATEHIAHQDGNICINLQSNRSLTITNSGDPIPESIADQIFYPFVTNKANNLGIGLTLALLYAKQIRGSISLMKNNTDSGISFTLCLPPKK